jgi:hypothetical protein
VHLSGARNDNLYRRIRVINQTGVKESKNKIAYFIDFQERFPYHFFMKKIFGLNAIGHSRHIIEREVIVR